jgi:hypothetical protein
MSDADFPPAPAAASFTALIDLVETFGRIVRAETIALRGGDRSAFEALTARKAEYQTALQAGMTALEPQRAKAAAPEKQRWQAAAAEAEAALQENAKLIAGEQLHAAAMLDMLRQTLRRQQGNAVGYGRDAKLKPRG